MQPCMSYPAVGHESSRVGRATTTTRATRGPRSETDFPERRYTWQTTNCDETSTATCPTTSTTTRSAARCLHEHWVRSVGLSRTTVLCRRHLSSTPTAY